MALHAQLECLQALQEQEGIEGAEGRSEIAQAFHAGFHNVGEVAERLIEADAVVALAGLEQLRKAAAIPRKAAAIDDDSTDRRPMPADELGGRMDHDIRAVLDRPAEV